MDRTGTVSMVPPVHAWATLFLARMEIARQGKPDVDFLKAAFTRLA
jgi:hypothetical protein